MQYVDAPFSGDWLYIWDTDLRMCGLQGAKIYGQLFRAAKKPAQPLSAQDSVLLNGTKI